LYLENRNHFVEHFAEFGQIYLNISQDSIK